MTSENCRHRGGQPGNQNARTHGYYSSILTDKELPFLEEAADIKGIDEEIAVLRAKFKAFMFSHPDDIRNIVMAAESLARLIRTKHRISDGNKEAQKIQTIAGALISMMPSLGVDPVKVIKARETL